MTNQCPSEQLKANEKRDGGDALCRLASILRCQRLRSLVYILSIVLTVLVSLTFARIAADESRLTAIEQENAARGVKIEEIDRNVRLLVDRLIQKSP